MHSVADPFWLLGILDEWEINFILSVVHFYVWACVDDGVGSLARWCCWQLLKEAS